MAAQSTGGHQLRPTAPHEQAAASQTQVSAGQSAGIAPALLTLKGLADLLLVSERTALKLLAEPWAPVPIVLGPRMVRHSADEWRAAIANMPRQAQRAQPESLLRSRIDRMKSTGVPA